MSRSPSPPKTDLSGAKVPRFNNGWTVEQEELMAGWSDIATCYRWMHDRCEKHMSNSNLCITVPVIILSTLTGSASFVMNSLLGNDPDGQKYAQIGVGCVSIFTGILTTLGNFFRYAQSSESNRVASISWGKFQRQIAVELALHPKDRIDCTDFLNICRAELDRLIEQSPPIPDKIIRDFEKEFKDLPTVKRPDIAHGIDHTKVFKNNDSRLKNLAADAATFLQQRRKVWHNSMMPDVDKHLDTELKKRIVDLSGSLFSALEERIKTHVPSHEHGRGLRYKVSERVTRLPFRGRPTPKPLASMAGQTIDQTLPSGGASSKELLTALTMSTNTIPGTSDTPVDVSGHTA